MTSGNEWVMADKYAHNLFMLVRLVVTICCAAAVFGYNLIKVIMMLTVIDDVDYVSQCTVIRSHYIINFN